MVVMATRSAVHDVVAAARRAHRPLPSVSTDGLDVGPRVQLSVRMPDRLRAAVAETAAAQGCSVTDYVVDALARALRRDNDSTWAIREALLDEVRPELSLAVTDLADEVDAIDRDEASWQSRP